MSSPEREREKALLAKIDEFAKKHNRKGIFIEAIHKKLFKLDMIDLEQVNACIDSRVRRKDGRVFGA